MYRLYTDASLFAKNAKKELEVYLRRYKKVFYILSVLIGLGTALGSIVTTLVLSKVIWSDYPDWFFFLTAGISAISVLMMSTINYFLIREKIHSYKRKIKWIEAEELKYHEKLSKQYQSKFRDYNLYLSVASYLDNISAKKEVQHD